MARIWFCVAIMLGARIGLAQVQFETDSLTLQLDETGRVAHVTDRSNQTDYVAVGHETPLLMAYINGELQSPQSATWHPDQQRLTLRLAGAEMEVATINKTSHLTFEIVRAEPLEAIERVQWGVATKIHDYVGEVVGVVRNERFAIGMLGLNVKTLGGPADHPEGRDVSRGRAAMPTDWGSSLHAYSMDRSRPRHVDVWGGQFPRMPVLPIPDETVVGSKIAVFGSPAASALDRVGEIEIAERLPHPVYQGMWSRKNKELGRSYLIAAFSEETVDEMIAYAKRANFLSLYHPAPFQSWGHYELSDRFFPNGEAGLKACAEKAKQAGLLLGVHTLTNFINTNDPFVTPVPDKRLAQTGSSVLVGQVALDSTTIEVASPEYFNNTRSNWLKTVMIGDELIRYSRVSESEPWQLLDCRRGAFGTKAASHETGTTVAKLMDHPYKVFLANHEMQQEIAQRLAELFNRTGINHLDFDGHEGCHASGQGDFGIETFAKVFYDNVQHFVHNGTSNSQPFYWHINTCCNWGEPWYGGFRSSMADYRINNQAMLERNFMPKMLGWFQLTADTTLADVEWLLARSAGYNSGFALSTSREALAANPHTPLLLDTIRTWEALRMNNAFTESQQAAMRDTSREFHLAPSEDHSLLLHPYRVSPTYEYAFYQRQPGEPTYAEWEYTQPGSAQELQFSLEVKGESGAVQDLSFEFDNYISFAVSATIEAGQTLLCDGSDTLRIYDTKGRQVKKVSLPKSPPKIPNGPHDVTFTCDFTGDPPPTVHVQFKAMEAGQPVQAKQPVP